MDSEIAIFAGEISRIFVGTLLQGSAYSWRADDETQHFRGRDWRVDDERCKGRFENCRNDSPGVVCFYCGGAVCFNFGFQRGGYHVVDHFVLNLTGRVVD